MNFTYIPGSFNRQIFSAIFGLKQDFIILISKCRPFRRLDPDEEQRNCFINFATLGVSELALLTKELRV